jgi:hypothetical protein
MPVMDWVETSAEAQRFHIRKPHGIAGAGEVLVIPAPRRRERSERIGTASVEVARQVSSLSRTFSLIENGRKC